jgi:hypothetical protein
MGEIPEINTASRTVTSAVEQLNATVTLLNRNVIALATSQHRTRVLATIVAVIGLLTLGGLIATTVLLGQVSHTVDSTRSTAAENRGFAECLAKWSRESAARSTALGKASNARSARLAELQTNEQNVLDIMSTPPVDVQLVVHAATVERTAYNAFLAADQAYNTAVTNNPVPSAPAPGAAC